MDLKSEAQKVVGRQVLLVCKVLPTKPMVKLHIMSIGFAVALLQAYVPLLKQKSLSFRQVHQCTRWLKDF